MLRVKNRSVSIMVLYCIALHLWWALIIVADVGAVSATPVDALYRAFDDEDVLVIALCMVALLALAGVFLRSPWVVWFLMPQQIMLLMSATGALSAIYLAQFADGVVRSRGFIAADQFHIVLAAIGHTVAVIAHARRRVV